MVEPEALKDSKEMDEWIESIGSVQLGKDPNGWTTVVLEQPKFEDRRQMGREWGLSSERIISFPLTLRGGWTAVVSKRREAL
jgi:hypothetical protein